MAFKGGLSFNLGDIDWFLRKKKNYCIAEAQVEVRVIE
jgi:hypothetical protein